MSGARKFRRYRLALMVAAIPLACVDTKLPPVSDSGSGNPSSASAGTQSGETSAGETGESGGEGLLDAPCTSPPNFEFSRQDAGLGLLKLGDVREVNCSPTYHPGLECAGEHFIVGAAIGDYDGDGFPDIALAGPDSAGALMRNLGNGSFEDAGSLSGVDLTDGAGMAWLDVDKDGDLDLFVTTWLGMRNRLYINQGNGTFLEDAASRGVDRPEPSAIGASSAAVGDYDLDGWPDIFSVGWHPTSVEDGPSPNRLFHNQGNTSPGVFDDETVSAGLEFAGHGKWLESEGEFWWGFSAAFHDLDGDDYPELYAVSDFGNTDLFENNGAGSFTLSSLGVTLSKAESGMGLALGDWDRDGDLDSYITSIGDPLLGDCYSDSNSSLGSRFFENLNGSGFAQREEQTRTRCSGWGWGVTMSDFDNDGLLDLALTNGHTGKESFDEQFAQDPDRYWSGNGSFSEPAENCSDEVKFDDTGLGRGLYPFDMDADGDLDLLEIRGGDSPLLYRNDGGNDARYLRIKAVGVAGMTSGRGAKIAVRATASDPWMVREIGLGSMFMGHGELIAHYGLADETTASEVRICWPVSKTMQVLNDVPADQVLVLNELVADIPVAGTCASALLAD